MVSALEQVISGLLNSMALGSRSGVINSDIGMVGIDTPDDMFCNPSFQGQGVVVTVVVVVVLHAPLPNSSFVVHDADVDGAP